MRNTCPECGTTANTDYNSKIIKCYACQTLTDTHTGEVQHMATRAGAEKYRTADVAAIKALTHYRPIGSSTTSPGTIIDHRQLPKVAPYVLRALDINRKRTGK